MILTLIIDLILVFLIFSYMMKKQKTKYEQAKKQYRQTLISRGINQED
jgi:preprotein translocase subunit YajC